MKKTRLDFDTLEFKSSSAALVMVLVLSLAQVSVAEQDIGSSQKHQPQLFCEDQYQGQKQTTFEEGEEFFAKLQRKYYDEVERAAQLQPGYRYSPIPVVLYSDIYKELIKKITSETDDSTTRLLEPIDKYYLPRLLAAPENLKFQIFKSEVPGNYSNVSNKHQMISIFFENLTIRQFNYLKNTFGQGQSDLKYDPSITYRLQDFFPRTLQAVAAWFPYTQCTGFVSMYLDATQTRTRISPLLAHHDALIERLQDSKYFKRLHTGEKLEPGDILVHVSGASPSTVKTEREYIIDHTYIYLDENLSIGSNPGGLRYGVLDNNDGEYLKNGIFAGIDYEISLKSPLAANVTGMIAYRRLNWNDEPLAFRHYHEGAPAIAFTVVMDHLGRHHLDRTNLLYCGKH